MNEYNVYISVKERLKQCPDNYCYCSKFTKSACMGVALVIYSTSRSKSSL